MAASIKAEGIGPEHAGSKRVFIFKTMAHCSGTFQQRRKMEGVELVPRRGTGPQWPKPPSQQNQLLFSLPWLQPLSKQDSWEIP